MQTASTPIPGNPAPGRLTNNLADRRELLPPGTAKTSRRIARAAAAAKVAGGLLALALVRPWGRVVQRGGLLAGSAGASALLVAYGGLNVLLGALVLSCITHPAGGVDRTALRWHVGVWDLWFLAWGIVLSLATVGYWRRTATGPPRDGGS